MNYPLLKDSIDLLKSFIDSVHKGADYPETIEGYKQWIADHVNKSTDYSQINWDGKDAGRTPESVISTLLVHMNRYAKTYSKSAIYDSVFSTQEEFIYLIVLKSFGEMSKMDLIKKNIHEKPAGMKIIDRLIKQGWVDQQGSDDDKRSKLITINEFGLIALEQQMHNIRSATQIVSGNLSYNEKIELIKLLQKLDHFHHYIYKQNIPSSKLINKVYSENFNSQ